jgi:hypothetical protein
MKIELVELEQKPESGEKDTWRRSRPPIQAEAQKAESSAHAQFLRQLLELSSSHENSPLND